MRQKKSKLIYYAVAAFLLAGLFFIATQQIPLRTEHVSEPVANDFLSK
jgi:hypothetical protein